MKDAQDAVKEIREWPVQKYLIENEDGSIEFSDNKPGRVVCTREEFFNALKERQMKTLTEAVKSCGGVWPSDSLEGVGVGWNGKSTDREPDFIQLGIGGPEFTRSEFEAEARRQGYVEGFEGYPDDVAFKGHDLPAIGEECEIDSHGTGSFFLCIPKYHGVNSSVVEIWSGDTAREVWIQREHAEFRPLKSDRERWVKGACSLIEESPTIGDMIETIYDALKSGELPKPEGK